MIINKTDYLEFKCTKSPMNHDWYYVKRTNDSSGHDSAVCITTILKYDKKQDFLFLKTRRPPLYSESKSQYCIESPAGLIADENPSENLIECVKKELIEETGYCTDEIYLEINNSSTSSGLSSETLTYVTAIISNTEMASEPISDGGVISERFFVPCNQIYDYLMNLDTKTYSVASATVCGIFFALKRI